MDISKKKARALNQAAEEYKDLSGNFYLFLRNAWNSVETERNVIGLEFDRCDPFNGIAYAGRRFKFGFHTRPEKDGMLGILLVSVFTEDFEEPESVLKYGFKPNGELIDPPDDVSSASAKHVLQDERYGWSLVLAIVHDVCCPS